MSIAGRAAPSPDTPVAIERILRAVTLTSAKSQRGWAAGGVRFGSADDGCLATGPGGRACVFDGRIDNRAELARALGIDGGERADAATLALAAYAKWGDDFASHIIGDWACALWDDAGRRLVLAVDPMAMRPLYFHHTADGSILFASEVRGLHADADVPRALDEGRVAEWLCLLPTSAERTFFEDVRRVAGGSVTVWRGGRVSTTSWWRPLDAPMLSLKRPEDYAEAMRASFEEAVACRIAGDDRIGSHLSGGLDSTSVTAVAARQLAAQGRGLTAFTAAPAHAFRNPPGRFGDEWGHAAAVAALYSNVDHVRVSNDDRPLLDVLALRDAAQDTPQLNMSNMVWVNGIERTARDRGIGVMLTGAMGNMTISYDGGEFVAAQIRSGRLVGAARTVLDMRKALGWRWLRLIGLVGDAALPVPLRRRLRALFGKGEVKFFDFNAINPQFLDLSGLAAIGHGYAGNVRNFHIGDGRALRLAVLRRSDYRGDFNTAGRRLYGVDTRDPTLDRRLFELCLSIPDDQFLHKGMPRSLVRRAMADVLPRVVLDETGKGLQAPDWAVPFDQAMPEMRAELARLRASPSLPAWLDLDRMEAMLDRWPGPDEAETISYDYLIAFSRALATGRFVRRIEGGNG